jgi:DNA-binding NarL/FixJ family response regulator
MGIMKAETSIVIVDAHPIFRHGLRQIIEAAPGFKVVGEAGDGETGLALIEQCQPTVAILDIDMPKVDGFELAQTLHDRKLPVKIVFLTLHAEEDFVNLALDLDVPGYVLKESAINDIVACLRAVLAGQTYLSPSVTSVLVNRRRRADSLLEHQPGLKDLTPTERKVLKLIAEYKTSKDIAEELSISYRTVENHRTNICTKLDLHGSHALIKFALRHKSELA